MSIRKTIIGLLKRLVLGKPPTEIEGIALRIDALRRMGATIGRNVRLLGRVDGLNPHLVTIGDSCVIGAGSILLSHCAIKGALPVAVENEVWIGFGAIVLPGVTVGKQSVVGAGAVVTKDVPPRSIVAGNPARILRQLTDEEVDRIGTRLRAFEPTSLDADRADGP